MTVGNVDAYIVSARLNPEKIWERHVNAFIGVFKEDGCTCRLFALMVMTACFCEMF
ncbi:hypothetical protein [Desulfoplanes formicivorans]|uniref:hypothetical protein n=1 Tax=Desulfoplanes formicivorans TaxID=1592317 RepID=UPI00159F022D|nr:hypothetical protein [Desulfoplanes formicivorans]